MTADTQEFAVDDAAAGQRLDAFLAAQPEMNLSRSQVQRLIEQGKVRVHGRFGDRIQARPSYKLASGDSVEVEVPPPEPAGHLQAEAIPLDILYEDADVVVINKPRGLVVHPAAGHEAGTLVHALLHHCTDLSGIGGEVRPGIVHRLDKDTTGVLVVAKNDLAHQSLSEQIKNRTATREYLALVHGTPPSEQGVIDAPVGRHPVRRKEMAINYEHGRPAVTHFRLVERFPATAGHGPLSLLACKLQTGRTHQVRVHLTSLGCPVVGDPVYGAARGDRRPSFGLAGQALHARRLGFIHPRSGEWMTFEAPLPEDFAQLLDLLRSESQA